jgi:phospholipid transport system substrate-binding protein
MAGWRYDMSIGKGLLYFCFALNMCFYHGQAVAVQSVAADHCDVKKSAIDTVSMATERALNVINTSNVESEKVSSEFQDILSTFFATDSISKFILGRNTKMIETDKVEKFARCFINMLVKLYYSEFLKYKNGKFNIINEKKISEKYSIVCSTFSVDGNVYKVNWSVFLIEGKWLIFDVVVNGISATKIQKAGIDEKISRFKQMYKKGAAYAVKKILGRVCQ